MKGKNKLSLGAEALMEMAQEYLNARFLNNPPTITSVNVTNSYAGDLNIDFTLEEFKALDPQ